MRRILSLDGGGIRGLIASTLLEQLEQTQILMTETMHLPGRTVKAEVKKKRRTAKIFDLIAGTSTGGLLACALTVPKQNYPDYPAHSAGMISRRYEQYAETIFNGNFVRRNIGSLWLGQYSRDGLDLAVNKILGETRLSQAVTRVMVPTWNLTAGREHFWKSWKSGVTMRDTAISTASAPTYFEPYEFQGAQYVDGGIFANNPTAFAIAEAQRLWPNEEIAVLSIGTSGDVPAIELSSPGLIGWLKGGNIVKVMLESGQLSHGTLAELMMSHQPSRYVRVTPDSLGIEMDASDSDSLNRLKMEGHRLAERHMPAILEALSE